MRSLARAALCALLLIATAVSGQDLTRNRLEADIRFLSDDLLQGRGTPGPGLEIAARYLAGELQKCGWAPGNAGSFMQPYTVMSYEPSEASYSLRIDGVELPKEDFVVIPITLDPSRPIEGKTVLAGHGIDYPEKGVRDYAGVNPSGRIVVAFSGAPWPVDPTTPFGPDQVIGKLISATSRGAQLLVLVTPDIRNSRDAMMARAVASGAVAYLPDTAGRPTSGLGSGVVISSAAFDRYFAKPSGRTFASWQKVIGKKSAKTVMNTTIRVELTAKPQPAAASNVVAILEGSDPKLKDEWVVLTAHYDHLGLIPDGKGGNIVMNGADDNASGTAAVLEVARRLAAGPRPKRSVLVLLLSGEERGLIGSAHYSNHPLVAYKDVVANVNVDMVGRSDGSVQAITQSPALLQLATDLGAQAGIKVLGDQQVPWRVAYLTDSYHFSRFDIPAVEFFTGMHGDYHAPTDDADKIQFENLARIMTVMHGVARSYADGAERPAVKRPEWYVTP
jgi:hypothetical protein